MTPEEHYAEAERITEVVQKNAQRANGAPVTLEFCAHQSVLLARAQVHATLATVPLSQAGWR